MIPAYEIDRELKKLLAIYEGMTDELIKLVADMIGSGKDVEDIEKWLVDKLVKQKEMERRAGRITEEYSAVGEAQAERIVDDIIDRAIELDERGYKLAPLLIVPFLTASTDPIVNNIKSTTKYTVTRDLRVAAQTAKNYATGVYADIVNKTYTEVSSGQTSINTALRNGLKKFAEKGITSYKYPSGREVTIEGYLRTHTTTMINQAAGEASLARGKAWGNNLYEVTSHAGARPTHAVWQGAIYTESELSSVCGYGDVGGLKGANCYHDFYPFIEGVSKQTYFPVGYDENMRVYEEQQQQRGFERKIRAAKREKLAAQDDTAKAEAQQKLRREQGKLNDFLKQTGRTKRDRMFVAG